MGSHQFMLAREFIPTSYFYAVKTLYPIRPKKANKIGGNSLFNKKWVVLFLYKKIPENTRYQVQVLVIYRVPDPKFCIFSGISVCTGLSKWSCISYFYIYFIPSHSMNVRLSALWKIKVYYVIDIAEVNTTGNIILLIFCRSNKNCVIWIKLASLNISMN